MVDSARILLIGPSGQIGRELQRTLPNVGTVVSAGRTGANMSLDLTNADSIRDVIKSVSADIIVNAAAYTAVDQAETEGDKAFAINADAPGVLAECAKRRGSLLVHFSTDYVFDGDSATAYKEDDDTNPLSEYGKSKLAGEQAIRAAGGRYLILRTSWVYGLHGKNFLLTILRLATQRKMLRIVDDQFGVPNWSRSLAEAVTAIIDVVLRDRDRSDDKPGTYHLTAMGETSWHEFARTILESVRGEPDILAESAHPIPTSEYPTPAPRPMRSTLDGGKVARTFGVTLPDWRTCLQRCLAERSSAL